MLRHAPAAGEHAARLGAHREAAAQYARALRWAGELPVAERAELLEHRSYECYLTDQIAEAIEAREQALECHRELGDGVAEGDARRWLSRLHWFQRRERRGRAVRRRGGRPARAAAARAGARDGLLATAHSSRCSPRTTAAALDWGGRAIALAESLGEEEIVIHALNNVGAAAFEDERPERSRGARAQPRDRAGRRLRGARRRAYCNLASIAVKLKRHVEGAPVIAEGIAYCTDHDLDSWTHYMLAWRAWPS